MGIAGPRYYDPYFYPPPLYYPPPTRILYVNQPAMVPIPTVVTATPTTTPVITNNRMVMVSPTQNDANPMNNAQHHRHQISNSKMKNTIENLADFVEEQELTKNMLEKGHQKNCSICLENYLIGDKIVYLPCFHFYHTKCIQTWMKSSDKCPLCNVEIKFQ